MTIGEKIAKCRREKNLTQEQLGELLNVTRQSISRWESDLAYPETDTLIQLSNIFECSLDYLLKEDLENGTNNVLQPTVGTLLIKHWRKIYIPLYIAGTCLILIGILICIIGNIMIPTGFDSNSFSGGLNDFSENQMLSRVRIIFTIFGSIAIVGGIVSIVVATVLFLKDQKQQKAKYQSNKSK